MKINFILINSMMLIAKTFYFEPSYAAVNITRLDNGNVVLKGDVSALNFQAIWLGSQTTYTQLWMDKQHWLRTQQDWHSPSFGEASMRSFLNSALSQGISLGKTGSSSTDITPRVQICLNDAGRLLVYCFSGAAVIQPEPVKCNFSFPATIDLGAVTVEEIDNHRKSIIGTISCDNSAQVKLTFSYLDGSDAKNIAPGVNARLRIENYPGNSGLIYSVSAGAPSNSDINVTLTSIGAITPGKYSQSAIVNMTMQ
ncbi:hypothetical protein ACRS9C_11540 [Serratia marcescens]|uniref:MrpH family fimbial adhesin n=1 Tax=Serratia marcescens TaxID=615 RepID=UPI003EDF6628